MTEPRQLFGWTEPKSPPPGEYVRFLAVFSTEHGIVITVRNEEGTSSSVAIPHDSAEGLAQVILSLGRPSEPKPARGCSCPPQTWGNCPAAQCPHKPIPPATCGDTGI